jgi:hypothetical protein
VIVGAGGRVRSRRAVARGGDFGYEAVDGHGGIPYQTSIVPVPGVELFSTTKPLTVMRICPAAPSDPFAPLRP